MRSQTLTALAFAVLLFCGLACLLSGNDAARRAVFPAKAAPAAKAPAPCPCDPCACDPCDCPASAAGKLRPWFPGKVILRPWLRPRP